MTRPASSDSAMLIFGLGETGRSGGISAIDHGNVVRCDARFGADFLVTLKEAL